MTRFEGRIALVTGGLSGIGAAVAARLTAEGATVVAADLTATGDDHLDVSDEASCAALVAAVMAAHGRIDCMVNSAGIGADTPFLQTTAATFDRIVAVNLRGTFLIGQACARAMRPGAAIVNISSVSGLRGNTGRAAYGASKAGVLTLTQVMACELAEHGIRVNAIAPGPVDTPLVEKIHDAEVRAAFGRFIPMHRYGTPAEIAAAAAYLCSDDASYVTGQTLAVDGGFLASGMKRG
jgi:NAD(P)-dependent dehydrogenase (short-subunit alcohol dehydrogenase family)